MPLRMDQEPETEKQVQALVVEALKKLGYLVQETSLKITGKRTKWNLAVGIDAGIPDLLVGRDGWGPIRLALEMKGPKTVLSEQQKILHGHDLIEVARSLDEALAAIAVFQQRYGLRGPTVTRIA
jgi:hypothetical protein